MKSADDEIVHFVCHPGHGNHGEFRTEIQDAITKIIAKLELLAIESLNIANTQSTSFSSGATQ